MSTARLSLKLPDERLIHVWSYKLTHSLRTNCERMRTSGTVTDLHGWTFVGDDTVQSYPSQYLIRPGAVRRKLLEVIASATDRVDDHVIYSSRSDGSGRCGLAQSTSLRQRPSGLRTIIASAAKNFPQSAVNVRGGETNSQTTFLDAAQPCMYRVS